PRRCARQGVFDPVWYTAPRSSGVACTKQDQTVGLRPAKGRGWDSLGGGADGVGVRATGGSGLTQGGAEVGVDLGPVPVEALDHLGPRERVTLTDEHREEALARRVIEDLAVERARLAEVVVLGVQGRGGARQLAIRLPAALA